MRAQQVHERATRATLWQDYYQSCLMQPFRFLWDLTKSFLRHGCASLAASLAFFSLLSLFPLVFLLLYGLSFVVNQEHLATPSPHLNRHCRRVPRCN